jgi:iron only hydrogenase large subunit-like protein
MGSSKWNAEDRRLVSIIKETEEKLTQTRADRQQSPHLQAACDEWIERYEKQLLDLRAQLEQVKSLYA